MYTFFVSGLLFVVSKKKKNHFNITSLHLRVDCYIHENLEPKASVL